MSNTFQTLQSDPPSEIEKAIISAELLTLVPPKDMVPSSEKVFGSIKTRSSHLSQSLIINLLCWKDPSLK